MQTERERIIAKLEKMAGDFDTKADEAGDFPTDAMWRQRAITIRQAILELKK